MKNVKFRCKKTQIPRLGSKLRGPRQTVGPTDDDDDDNDGNDDNFLKALYSFFTW